ncbi:MAG: redoxin family protein [Alphaproteobacteria bacterium]
MIKIGDEIVNDKVMVVGKTAGVMLHDILGKKSVLFAVPGAFTPTCAMKHLPSYLWQQKSLADKGIDKILCLAVNDIFVMTAWEKMEKSQGIITMIADGSAVLTKKWGMEFDLTDAGLGVRSQRYAMLLEGAVVRNLFLEKKGEYKVSSAEYVLRQI